MQVNFFTKQKRTHGHREQTHGSQRGKEGGGQGRNYEFGTSRYKLLYIKQVNNKVLLHSTGNYIQYTVINQNGKEYKKEYIYIY